MKFILIQAESRNLRQADANEERRSMSSVTTVQVTSPSDS